MTAVQVSESVRKDAEEVIAHFEGEHLKSYVLPGETWATIGIGCAIPMKQHPLTITKEESRKRFQAALDVRINKIPAEIGTAAWEKMSDGQKVAYLSFRFNVKDSVWMKSETRKKLLAGDIIGFFSMAAQWCRDDRKKILPGLQRRRKVETSLSTGVTVAQIKAKNWYIAA